MLNPKKTQEEICLKRNRRLLEFFYKLDLDIKVIGDINTPAVILNDKKVMNCYAHNFNLIFTDQPHDGEELFRYKLTHVQNFTQEDKDKIYNWLFGYTHRECFKIELIGTPLFLAGFNVLNKHDHTLEEELYPVFAKHNYKLYFSKESAQSTVDKFQEQDLKFKII